MFLSIQNFKKNIMFRVLVGTLLLVFVLSLPTPVMAQTSSGKNGDLTAAFHLPAITGITVNPQNPLQFEFLIDVGSPEAHLQTQEAKSAEYSKLIRYFLASLTVPEKNLWVNLSPYEKNRIIAEDFGRTQMGRDLLSQDYILKQMTASMMNPLQELGKEFWQKVYHQAQAQFGTIDIPVNTFNKVWIVSDKASVYKKDNTVFLIESHLKVMLEEDYKSLDAGRWTMEKNTTTNVQPPAANVSAIVREIIIPAIEKEVNEGKSFANLRQINNSLILATWYKTALKESLLSKIYVDRGKTDGVNQDDVADNQRIYQEYLEAFKKGAFNFIKEEVDPVTEEIIPRKYFSGGYTTVIAGSPLSERIGKLSDNDPRVGERMGLSKVDRVNVNLLEASVTSSSVIDAWVAYSQISEGQINREAIESRFLEIENDLPLDSAAREAAGARNVVVSAEPLTYLKEVVFYLHALDVRKNDLKAKINLKGKIQDAQRRGYEKERDAVAVEYARGKKIFTMILSLAISWYGVKSWDIEEVMGEYEKGAHLDLLLRGRNELVSLKTMSQIIVAIENLKKEERAPIVVSLLQRKIDLLHRENTQPIGRRIRSLIEAKGLQMSKVISRSDAQRLSQLSSGNGFTRNPEIFNRFLVPVNMTWQQFLDANDDIKQKLAEEIFFENELEAHTQNLSKKLVQLRGQRMRGDVVKGTAISPQLLHQYEQGNINRINPRHLPVFAQHLGVSVSQLWPQEDLMTFEFAAASSALNQDQDRTASSTVGLSQGSLIGGTPSYITSSVVLAADGLSQGSLIGGTPSYITSSVGGIDLNPANLNLQIKRDGKGVPLPLPLQDISSIDINGLTPVIINITPVPSLPLLLGVKLTKR